MTNTVKGSAWGFAFIDPGLLLKKILGSKPRPAFYTIHQLIYTESWLHLTLALLIILQPQSSRRSTVQACLELVMGIWDCKPGVLSNKLMPKKAPQSPTGPRCWEPLRQHSHGKDDSLQGKGILGSKPTSDFPAVFKSSPVHLGSLCKAQIEIQYPHPG